MYTWHRTLKHNGYILEFHDEGIYPASAFVYVQTENRKFAMKITKLDKYKGMTYPAAAEDIVTDYHEQFETLKREVEFKQRLNGIINA